MTAEPDLIAPPGEWQALHIFYSADARPILTDCVAPLVRDLRARGLLDRYFFINYWMEGGHVRLRLKPSSAAATAEVRHAAETAIVEFLARRPALYETDYDAMAEFYDSMFEMEYSAEEKLRMYQDGEMPIQDNNTFHYRAYEPEFGRYGGPAGIELAEWHFEYSSDLVIRLVQTTNVHVRSVMLGLSAQLMMIKVATFLGDPDKMANYLERYYAYWSTAFNIASEESLSRYQANYDSMKDALITRFIEVHAAIRQGDPERLTGFRCTWAKHCAELRDRVLELGRAGRLVFPPRSSPDGKPAPITQQDVLLPYLLTSYMHMTNNRLGATLIDEAYLAYMLSRAIQENMDRFTGDVAG
jgi:hypothetical protein